MLMMIFLQVQKYIVSQIEEKQSEIPGLIYKIFYIGSKYNLEEYYKHIEDERLLDEDYIKELQESLNIPEEIASEDDADENSENNNQSEEPPLENQ